MRREKGAENSKKRTSRAVPADYNKIRLSGKDRIHVFAVGGILGGLTVWICYSSIFALPVGAAVLGGYAYFFHKKRVRERRKLLNYHFRDFLSSLHTAMLAGYSLENAVRTAASDLERLYGKEDILCLELREMLRQMQLQKPVEQLFWSLGKRSEDEDIRNFASVIMIAKRMGGDVNGILQNAWRNISEKIDTEKEIDAVVASARYEQTIMSIMPAAVVAYLRLTFTGFLDTLYGNPAGVLLMSICLGVYLAAWYWGRSMTENISV